MRVPRFENSTFESRKGKLKRRDTKDAEKNRKNPAEIREDADETDADRAKSKQAARCAVALRCGVQRGRVRKSAAVERKKFTGGKKDCGWRETCGEKSEEKIPK